MNCFRFATVMSNTILFNAFNSDNSNITYIKTRNRQIRAIITLRILKVEPMITKSIAKNYTFFTVITFSNISSSN